MALQKTSSLAVVSRWLSLSPMALPKPSAGFHLSFIYRRGRIFIMFTRASVPINDRPGLWRFSNEAILAEWSLWPGVTCPWLKFPSVLVHPSIQHCHESNETRIQKWESNHQSLISQSEKWTISERSFSWMNPSLKYTVSLLINESGVHEGCVIFPMNWHFTITFCFHLIFIIMIPI